MRWAPRARPRGGAARGRRSASSTPSTRESPDGGGEVEPLRLGNATGRPPPPGHRPPGGEGRRRLAPMPRRWAAGNCRLVLVSWHWMGGRRGSPTRGAAPARCRHRPPRGARRRRRHARAAPPLCPVHGTRAPRAPRRLAPSQPEGAAPESSASFNRLAVSNDRGEAPPRPSLRPGGGPVVAPGPRGATAWTGRAVPPRPRPARRRRGPRRAAEAVVPAPRSPLPPPPPGHRGRSKPSSNPPLPRSTPAPMALSALPLRLSSKAA